LQNLKAEEKDISFFFCCSLYNLYLHTVPTVQFYLRLNDLNRSPTSKVLLQKMVA